MKPIVNVLAFLAATLTLVSCSSDEPKNRPEAVVTEAEPKNTETERVKDFSLLFTYTDKTDAAGKLNAGLDRIVSESLAEIPSIDQCAAIATKVTIRGGKAQITEFFYLDSRYDVIESYYLDPYSGGYQLRTLPTSPFEESGACPSGFSSIALCAGGDMFHTCWAGAVANYFTNNFNGSNACINILMTVTVHGVRVCGGGC